MSGRWRRPACGCVTGAVGVADAAARAERQLNLLAPELVGPFRAALPRAAASVSERLAAALWRERVGERDRVGQLGDAGRGARVLRRHAFDRVVLSLPEGLDPVDLLPVSVLDRRGWALAAELTDAVVNLAIGYARAGSRRAGLRALTDGGLEPDGDPGGVASGSGVDADGAALALERLAVEGHNLHPCARTRLGWGVADTLAHDLESGPTRVAFVAVPRRWHVGDDVGAALAAAYPWVPAAPAGHVCQPVHPWQRDAVLRRYPERVRPLAGGLPAWPTSALRTVLLPAGRDGRRRYLKLSLDVQITSTRRTISTASTRNGPELSRLLRRLVADDPDGGRVLLLEETAGAALDAGGGRDGSAILRAGLGDRLGPGEVAVPGGALPARTPDGTVLAVLVERYARRRGRTGRPAAAAGFLAEYARLLLPPLLRLATRYGVALEAHLQNCLPTFVAGVPSRMVFRDFAGLRLHRPRLAAAGLSVRLWPGSVVATDDVATMRAKLGYTAFQAHLGELVVLLAESHGLDEAAGWRAVREVVDEAYAPLRADPRYAAAAAADHAALTAARVPHKALVRMRLAGAGDLYVPVGNPLHVG